MKPELGRSMRLQKYGLLVTTFGWTDLWAQILLA